MISTRLKEQVYLLGSTISEITGSKLPSIRQCLSLFLHHHLDLKKTRHEASAYVTHKIEEYWMQKARIPTRATQHCQKKVEELFDEWRALKKNKGRKTDTQRKNEAEFCEDLDDLFDIAHADALTIIRNPQDSEFLIAQRKKGRQGCMAGVDETLHKLEKRRLKRQIEEDKRRQQSQCTQEMATSSVILASSGSDSEAEDTRSGLSGCSGQETEQCSEQVNHKFIKRGRKVVISSAMTAALDRAKVSDRKAMIIVTETAKCLGHDVGDFALNRETIRCSRQQHRQMRAEQLKAEFKADVPLVVHWDGKLLHDLTGNDHVDRLPVIITGAGVSQLLTAARLPSGTGEAQAKAVCDAVRDWGLDANIAGLSFDTTSSNTGRINGACVRIEQTLGRNLLFLACRHHVFELIIGAVYLKCMGVSDGPDVRIFKRFKEHWPFIDHQRYQDASSDESTAAQLVDIKDSTMEFISDHLLQQQPRDDYREMLELCLIFLGGKPKGGVRFMKPGAIHHARWMAKVIYTLKIWLFRSQFQLTSREERGLRDICVFTARLYVKAWFTASQAAAAPGNDLQLIKDLVAYEAVHKQIADAAATKFSSHLWYLSEELVVLSLFDDNTSADDKAAIVRAIQQSSPTNEEEPPKKAEVDLKTIKDRQLSSFASNKSLTLFELLKLPTTLLNEDPSSWNMLDDYKLAKVTVNALTVVNDHAERGVALVQEYSGLLTKDEEQLQFALQVVHEHRQRYPNVLKKTLAGSGRLKN